MKNNIESTMMENQEYPHNEHRFKDFIESMSPNVKKTLEALGLGSMLALFAGCEKGEIKPAEVYQKWCEKQSVRVTMPKGLSQPGEALWSGNESSFRGDWIKLNLAKTEVARHGMRWSPGILGQTVLHEAVEQTERGSFKHPETIHDGNPYNPTKDYAPFQDVSDALEKQDDQGVLAAEALTVDEHSEEGINDKRTELRLINVSDGQERVGFIGSRGFNIDRPPSLKITASDLDSLLEKGEWAAERDTFEVGESTWQDMAHGDLLRQIALEVVKTSSVGKEEILEKFKLKNGHEIVMEKGRCLIGGVNVIEPKNPHDKKKVALTFFSPRARSQVNTKTGK